MNQRIGAQLGVLVVAGWLSRGALAQLLPYGAEGYRYRITNHSDIPDFFEPGFDSSGWEIGCAPFGSDSACPSSNNQLSPCTFWPVNTDLLLLRECWVPYAEMPTLFVGVTIDNDVRVWFNGQEISDGTMFGDFCSPTDRFIIPVPSALVLEGMNQIAVRAIDRGGASYADVQLTVLQSPCSISDEPRDASTVAGQPVSFHVSHTAPVLHYQWFLGTAPLVDSGTVSGASTHVLSIANVSGEQTGSYTCLITPRPSTGCEPVRSRPAQLSCSPQLVANPSIIGSQAPDTVTIEASILTGESAAYEWLKDGEVIHDGDLYSGTQTQQLTLAVNTPQTIGAYSLRGSDACGSITTEPLEIGCFPFITHQPVGGYVAPGAVFLLEVQGLFNQFTTFAWYRDGIALEESAQFNGTRTGTLRITCLDEGVNGNYWAQISNECGTVSTEEVDVIARVACGADFNQDGGVDGSDISVFFQIWESGSTLADLNEDGGVDGGDVDTFFALWEAGGC